MHPELLCSLLLVTTPACGIKSQNFAMSDVSDGGGAIAGKLSVRYNGVPSTDACYACFNDAEVCVVPDPDGYVFHHLSAGTNAFSAIRCSGEEHRFEPHRFYVTPKAVTYFGSVFVEWRRGDDGAGGYAPVVAVAPIVGATIVTALREDAARLEIWDRHDEVFRRFIKQTGFEGPFFVSLAESDEAAAPTE
jgi:hypothetical protein